jgi:hypothetical protein
MKNRIFAPMKLMTPVDITNTDFSIAHTNKLLMIGSCFSESIGEKFQQAGFKTDVNPFGVLYNPLSIAKALKEIIEGKKYVGQDLFEYLHLWHSFMHHGSFSDENKEITLHNINSRLEKAHRELSETDRMFITLGSAHIYLNKKDRCVVSNCHKVPESHFIRERLTTEKATTALSEVFEPLIASNPSLKIILTVSPIRHLRDGLHENQLSKSILLLTTDTLQKQFPQNIIYFPAYEIVMDELRDYRYYAEDMMHPSQTAIDYVWEKLAGNLFSKETIQIAHNFDEIRKALSHKPLHYEENAYKEFLGQIVLKINRLKEKYPYLDLKL